MEKTDFSHYCSAQTQTDLESGKLRGAFPGFTHVKSDWISREVSRSLKLRDDPLSEKISGQV